MARNKIGRRVIHDLRNLLIRHTYSRIPRQALNSPIQTLKNRKKPVRFQIEIMNRKRHVHANRCKNLKWATEGNTGKVRLGKG
jgi:hypothetical protein